MVSTLHYFPGVESLYHLISVLALMTSDNCLLQIKAELQRVSNERLNLEDQLKESEVAQKNLEDTMSSIRSEVTELRTMHDEAIREKQEAMSKLAVLTQYFEEKEAQLTKYVSYQHNDLFLFLVSL